MSIKVFCFSALHIHTDILLWMLVIGAVVVLTWLLCHYVMQYRRLSQEQYYLNTQKHHDIEHELVLKTMHLATWRINLVTGGITFENDYRTSANGATPPPDTPFDEIKRHIVPWDRGRLNEGIEKLCANTIEEFFIQYQIRGWRSDRIFWSESYMTVSERDENGEAIEIVGTSSRIDEQKKQEDELIRARNRAEESDRLKTHFIANISHEVRTPLNAIVGFSHVLPTVENEEERKKLVGIIEDNNEQLLHIFDDMMNISKIEAGQSEIQLIDFNLSDMLDELVGHFKLENPSSKLPILMEIPDKSLLVHTDRNRLYDILNHFLVNAFKFTSSGNITVGFHYQSASLIRVWVQDTGKGIHENDQQRIFERFVKLDDFEQGIGLGLSICRSYALSIGAQIGVDSQVGDGSKFWVELGIS